MFKKKLKLLYNICDLINFNFMKILEFDIDLNVDLILVVINELVIVVGFRRNVYCWREV